MPDNQNSSELARCPFCGECAMLHCAEDEDSTRWWAQCIACGALSGEKLAESTPDREFAIAAWNRRTAPAMLNGVEPTREHIDAFRQASYKCAQDYDDNMSPEYRGLEAVFRLLRAADNRDAAGVEGLHPETADLVARFSDALAEKLAAAERKYGWDTHWKSPAWMEQCRQQLVEHVAKGDPRDVAAYCAFLWHHGESTAGGAVVVPRVLTLDMLEAGEQELAMGNDFADAWEAAIATMLNESCTDAPTAEPAGGGCLPPGCDTVDPERDRMAANKTPTAAPAGEAVALEIRRLRYQAERLESVHKMLGAAENIREAADKLERYCTHPPAAEVREVPWNDEVRNILGRPSFSFIGNLKVMRAAGREIPKKAEEEQAYCLHWLLNLYLRHGSGWVDAANAELEAMRPAALSPPGRAEGEDRG